MLGKILIFCAGAFITANAFALYCCCKAAGRADRMAEKMRNQVQKKL